jgi:uncharacterized membrane protein YraQ (UPF0718 family)
MNEDILNQLSEAGSFFIYGFMELSILFLGVSFLVEVINVFVSPQKVKKVLSSNKGGYLIASSLGSLTPFCSCSTIPLTLGLLKAKAAFGPIMTFLFTSPLLNPIVITVFWSAFGYEVTLTYALIAFFVSIFSGFVLEKFGFEKFIKKEIFEEDQQMQSSCCDSSSPQTTTACCDDNNKNTTVSFTPIAKQNVSCCETQKPVFSVNKPQNKQKKQSKWKQVSDQNLMQKTWKQFLSFAPYIAIGIGIGAFVHGFVPKELLTQYAGADNPLAIIVAALIGIPLYIRASSMVGMAPALLDGGVSMGAILALTVAGAGASLPEMIMLKKIFKLPIMIFFLVAVFSMAIGCGFLINVYFA